MVDFHRNRPQSRAGITKQISIFLPIETWNAIRDEALRMHIPVTELARRWMQPHIEQLPKKPTR